MAHLWQAFQLPILILGLAILLPHAASKAYPPLFMPLGRPMKILILTDIHYGEFQGEFQGALQDGLSTGATQALLQAERPDFVVVLGDLVTGENLKAKNTPLVFVRAMLNPLLNARVPFASTYGNHDISRVLPRISIFGFDSRLPRSYTQRQTLPSTPGITNYVLPIRGRSRGNPVVAQLVFLDSGGVSGLNQPGQADAAGVNWVTAAQVVFLNRALSRFRVPTYVFVHIPPPQFQQLQDNFQQNGCVGLKAEPQLAVQGQDEGLWAALLNNEQVVGVFSGHNHGSGWCCNAQRGPGKRPLAACFARHSGYGGYGNWPKAARIITVNPRQGYHLSTHVTGVEGVQRDFFAT